MSTPDNGKIGRRGQSLSLAHQFLLAATIVLLFGMSVIGVWVTARIEKAVTDNAAAITALYVESIIAPLTQDLAERNELTETARGALADMLKNGALSKRLFAFKIWATDGTLVFSDRMGNIGQEFGITEGLAAAISGRIHTEFNRLDGPESASERESGIPLLEIYSPIRAPLSGRIIGVAEFYEAVGDLETELTDARRKSWLIVALVTIAMLALLYGIVARGSRLILSQRKALDEKIATLSELLDQNRHLRQRVDQATRRTASLNERYLRRISADLHDGPAQSLAFVALRLDADPASVERDAPLVKEAVDQAMREIRDICRGLILPELDSLSVEETVRRAVTAHESRNAASVELDCETGLKSLSQAEKICVYRFIQEGLNNATRHAGGTGLAVSVTALGSGVQIVIRDGGPGFDRRSQSDGLGLLGLEERIAGLGGSFEIVTAAGAGTRLTMRLRGSQTYDG